MNFRTEDDVLQRKYFRLIKDPVVINRVCNNRETYSISIKNHVCYKIIIEIKTCYFFKKIALNLSTHL